jgi:hypothetical protein
MFLERSTAHRNQLVSEVEQDVARSTERQMEIQHRLHRPEQREERYDGKIHFFTSIFNHFICL